MELFEDDTYIWTPAQKLLALSIKQPYAGLMLHGKIETRTWNTNYRGWVMICANKLSFSLKSIRDIAGNGQFERIFNTLPGRPDFNNGKAIAIGRLSGCRPMQPSDEDKCFVAYNPDLYCHIYENVQAIEPFPWKGSQGWKEVNDEIKKTIKIIA